MEAAWAFLLKSLSDVKRMERLDICVRFGRREMFQVLSHPETQPLDGYELGRASDGEPPHPRWLIGRRKHGEEGSASVKTA
jgi:hypothetical protein